MTAEPKLKRDAADHLDVIMTGVDMLARSLTPADQWLSEDTEKRILAIREAVAFALGCDPFADYAELGLTRLLLLNPR